MLKKHKNTFFKAVQDSGLNPSNFYGVELSRRWLVGLFDELFRGEFGEKFFTIGVRNSPLKFVVQESKTFRDFNARFVKFVPGFSWSSWTEHSERQVIEVFRKWLCEDVAEYIRENELPDFWSQLEMYSSVIESSGRPAEDFGDFTAEEKVFVRKSIAEFQKQVEETFKPSEDQTRIVREHLEYLSAGLDRLNKFDWRGLAVSTLISIAVNLSVDTSGGRVLIQLFQRAFQSAIHCANDTVPDIFLTKVSAGIIRAPGSFTFSEVDVFTCGSQLNIGS